MTNRIFKDTGIAKSDPAMTNVAEFSVSELSGKVKRLIEDEFGRVRVRGEIGRVSRPASGHVYFDLKDDRAVLAAVTWKGGVSKLAHRPEEGMEVIATGRLTTFPGSSKYQIIVEQIEPAGAGALMALLEERKKKLGAEGLFAAERKQLLPFMPMVIGVVTSPSGAVIRDILHRIADRFPLHVIVWPVRVQGETSGAEVAAAIHGFNKMEHGGPVSRPDVLIVARGGGSVEDLWGFNDEEVVRAAAASMIPIVSAVGHETDWTLIDLAADVRAPTPTGAAEMVVPVKADLEANMASLAARLRSGLQRNMDTARTGLRAAARGMPTPDSLFAIQSQRFDTAASSLPKALVSVIQKKGIDFEKINGKLGASLLSAPVERKKQSTIHMESRLRSAMRSRIEYKANWIARTRLSPGMFGPVVSNARQRIDFAGRSLERLQKGGFEGLRQRLDQAVRLLGSYSHEKTLERGFVLVRDKKGRVMTRADRVAAGNLYDLEFSDAKVEVLAQSGKTGGVTKKAKPKSESSSSTDGKQQGSQGTLF